MIKTIDFLQESLYNMHISHPTYQKASKLRRIIWSLTLDLKLENL